MNFIDSHCDIDGDSKKFEIRRKKTALAALLENKKTLNFMKYISHLAVISIFLSGAALAVAQKKTKTPVKRVTGRTISRSVPVVEVENWKEFDSKELNLKLIFPKEPTISIVNKEELGVEVKSTIIQSYINTDYYLVEVREYPEGIIPDGTDLGESYGDWLKTFILSRIKIKSERAFDYGQYRMVEFVYQQIDGEVLIHRALVVGNKLYQIILQFEIKNPDTLDQTIEKNKGRIDKFFLSFELNDEQFIS